MALHRIKEVLEKQGRSQVWLGKEMGLSKGAISNLVSDKSSPTIRRIYKIAEILNVSPCDLLIEPKKDKS